MLIEYVTINKTAFTIVINKVVWPGVLSRPQRCILLASSGPASGSCICGSTVVVFCKLACILFVGGKLALCCCRGR